MCLWSLSKREESKLSKLVSLHGSDTIVGRGRCQKKHELISKGGVYYGPLYNDEQKKNCEYVEVELLIKEENKFKNLLEQNI